jgi:hypothetical protein
MYVCGVDLHLFAVLRRELCCALGVLVPGIRGSRGLYVYVHRSVLKALVGVPFVHLCVCVGYVASLEVLILGLWRYLPR